MYAGGVGWENSTSGHLESRHVKELFRKQLRHSQQSRFKGTHKQHTILLSCENFFLKCTSITVLDEEMLKRKGEGIIITAPIRSGGRAKDGNCSILSLLFKK